VKRIIVRRRKELDWSRDERRGLLREVMEGRMEGKRSRGRKKGYVRKFKKFI